MTLYHYTCADSLPLIEADGWLVRPHLSIATGTPLAWFTDLPVPDREGLGLTGYTLNCDRTEHRLRAAVEASLVEWWRWCRVEGVSRIQRDVLELTPGAQPLRWWVSPSPVAVSFDPIPPRSRKVLTQNG